MTLHCAAMQGKIVQGKKNRAHDGHVEIYEASANIYFVSEGHVTQSPAVAVDDVCLSQATCDENIYLDSSTGWCVCNVNCKVWK
jgi:hypothetical protein